MTPICPECDHEMIDENEGYSRLRFGPPSWVCKNVECPRCCDNIVVAANRDIMQGFDVETAKRARLN